MKIKHLFLLLLCTPMVWSCSEDSTPQPAQTGDLPHSVIGDQAKPYAVRLEVPAIKDPSMFIVHYTDFNGVTYSLEWDKTLKTQRWAAYTMNKNNNTKGWDRGSWDGASWKGCIWGGDPFQEDSIIPAAYRTKLSDYKSTGYDRGHIVNSLDRLISQNANGQTYYLSNIQPQLNKFNAQFWLNCEKLVHNWGTALRADETLYIVKGGTTQVTTKVPNPFIADSRIKIPVPRYFFMAILKGNNTTKKYQAIALWAEHKENYSTNVRAAAISVDELEARTGIDFFHNLDDATEKDVEASCVTGAWSWGSYAY